MGTGLVLMAIGAAELRLSLHTVHLEYADMKTVVAGVAYALVRAASRLISTHGPSRTEIRDAHAGRRDESRRGTHECVRHAGLLTFHSPFPHPYC